MYSSEHRRNALSLVTWEQLARKPATILLFEIHVGKRLSWRLLLRNSGPGAAGSGAPLLT
jgi:hypothetical protein